MAPKTLAWDELEYELTPWIKDAISSMGFSAMTPVQASTIPLFCANKDVIVEAVTGSGKTLAFAIPIIEKISKLDSTLVKKKHFNAVVLSPTRELAIQISNVFDSILKFNPAEDSIRTQLVFGGVSSVQDDLRKFQNINPQIIIATPGRFADLLSHPNLVHAKNCEIMVLDEADKLLDLNFEKEMNKIFSTLPKQKRVGLFSATISTAASNFHRTGLRNPVKIVVNSKSHKPNSLQINYCAVEPKNKISTLFYLLNKFHFRKAIVYFPTCLAVEYFYSLFKQIVKSNKYDLTFYSLHGKLKTNSRIKTLEKFDSNSTSDSKSILMTTDVAARGIDIDNVDLVIQLDPPTDADVFLHRCGRTGRANNFGQAIVMLNEGNEEDYVDFLKVRQIELDELQVAVPDNNLALSEEVKKWILQDRARHDKAIRSYVSFIRAYSKHSASSIFRLQSLDYVGIAKMYGLLRLPAMPEIRSYLKNKELLDDGYLDKAVDFSNYKYLDAAQEAKRIQELAKAEKTKQKKQEQYEKKKLNSVPWSKNSIQKETKVENNLAKEKRKRERDFTLLESDEENQQVDWKDLVRESKKEKKAKKSNVIASFEDL